MPSKTSIDDDDTPTTPAVTTQPPPRLEDVATYVLRVPSPTMWIWAPRTWHDPVLPPSTGLQRDGRSLG